MIYVFLTKLHDDSFRRTSKSKDKVENESRCESESRKHFQHFISISSIVGMSSQSLAGHMLDMLNILTGLNSRQICCVVR
jgi:hypothetical protein